MKFSEYKSQLETKIKRSYEEGVTLEEAEKLAGEFLQAMLDTSTKLKNMDLDAKMKKAGLKAVKARTFLDTLQSGIKLTEAGRVATVDSNELVNKSQDDFDQAEATKEDLERVFMTFKECHIHFRGIAKGRFE